MKKKLKFRSILLFVLFVYALIYAYYQFFIQTEVGFSTKVGRIGAVILIVYLILDYFFNIRKYLTINRMAENIVLELDTDDKRILHIRLPEVFKEDLSVEIRNVAGDIVIAERYNQDRKKKHVQRIQLNLNILRQGFYFVKVFISYGGKTYNSKIWVE